MLPISRSISPAQLRKIADSLADVQGILEAVVPGNYGFSAGGRKEAGKNPHDGGFAGPVRPEKAKNFALVDAEADIVDGAKFAIILG